MRSPQAMHKQRPHLQNISASCRCDVDFITAFRPRGFFSAEESPAPGDALFLPLRAEIERICQSYIGGFDIPPVLPAQNGNDAGILGAAALFS